MGRRSVGAMVVVAMVGGSLPIGGLAQTETPSFRSLSACLIAKEAAFQEKETAWTKLKAIHQPLSGEFSVANEDHRQKSSRYVAISGVCSAMERNERPLADQVKELTGLLDGLGPTGGSVNAPVAGAIRQHNLTSAGDKLEQVGGTLDQVLADFRASDFGSGSVGARSSGLVGKPDPALGAQAASALRADIAAWNREEEAREAKRQQLAAIEADRRRIEMAALAEQQRQRQAQREAEQQATKKSGFWNTLGTIAGVGLGVAIGVKGGGNSQTAQAMQNLANAQALANAGRSSAGSSGGGSSCSLSSSDFSPEPPSTGNMCQDARAHVAWLERDAGRARSCGSTQLMQYYEDVLRDARSNAASVCR